MAKKTETAVAKEPVSKFSKRQIVESQRYGHRRDLLNALLKDEQQYSHAEVEALIDEFMTGKVG